MSDFVPSRRPCAPEPGRAPLLASGLLLAMVIGLGLPGVGAAPPSGQGPARAQPRAPARTPSQPRAQAPAEAPAQTPAQTPTEAPTEAPTETPTEAPAEAPVQAPAPAKTAAEAPPPRTPEGSLLAFGDVHGDHGTFLRLLETAGLIDARGSWTGGTRRVVQTGDFLDRGDESRKVMELLLRLEEEARAAGGELEALLGNHEVMNLTGDLRYATPEDLRAYLPEESAELRARKKREVLDLVGKGSPLLVSRYYAELARVLRADSFDRIFLPGQLAHEAAFSTEGRYGKWLRKKSFLHRERGLLFLHGGLSPRFGRVPLEELNRACHEALDEYFRIVGELERLGVFHRSLGSVELQLLVNSEKKAGGPRPELRELFAQAEALFDGVLFAEDGPLWYRGLAQEAESRLARDVGAILAAQGASRIVVGHTQPESLRVEARFGGRVLLIDTGMNQRAFGGRPSALVVEPGGAIRVWE